jgi:hypothetical protein
VSRDAAAVPPYDDRVVDYHDFLSKDSPPSERRRLNTGDVWANQARCLECGDLIRSRNRHDYVTCSCGSLSVDGGSWYCKRSYKEGAAWEDLSESFDIASDEEEQ